MISRLSKGAPRAQKSRSPEPQRRAETFDFSRPGDTICTQEMFFNAARQIFLRPAALSCSDAGGPFPPRGVFSKVKNPRKSPFV